MNASDLSAELRDLLLRSREVSDGLLTRLGGDADPVEIVGLLEPLALLDERRGRVVEQFRKQASSVRRREEERSIRQFVLSALERIGGPQTTGFLEDYVYATELVEAKSRGMGALRRDEYRAWDRLRDQPRKAYIVPCLDEEGRPVSRWMARSDWPLPRRLVVEAAEQLWELERVEALLAAYRESDPDAEALFRPLVARYSPEVLGEEVDEAASLDDERLRRIRAAVSDRRASIEPAVIAAQEKTAARFAEFDEAQQFWGVNRR